MDVKVAADFFSLICNPVSWHTKVQVVSRRRGNEVHPMVQLHMDLDVTVCVVDDRTTSNVPL